MIKKYLAKFTIDIAPSIIATIVGAYIVNHYIVPKSDDAKPAAAVASTPDAKADNKTATRPAGIAADVANILDGVTSKAKSALDKSPLGKDADKGAEKPADKPAVEKASIEKPEKSETASESRRHAPTPRERAVAKLTPAPAPVAPAAVAPALATVGTAPAEANVDDRRDANDLARAAIERLSRESRAQEPARAAEPARVQEAARIIQPQPSLQPVQQAQPMQQLPPPIVLATPSVEAFPQQADSSSARGPRPPGDIPTPLPVDLQSDASTSRPDRTNVAEDVLSAAKSVFHSVIPKQFDR